jgi:FkbM family methyltransferase
MGGLMALGALFYPKGTPKNPIKFEELFIPYIYKEIYLDGIYIDIFNTKSDMVVVDIGANVGIVTQYMRGYAKKLYAVEPSSEHFEALKRNKEFNGWDNVEVFQLAIADRDGEMTLNLNEQNRTCHSLTLDYKHGGEKVKTKRMDTFFEENKIDEVDFMKFDVEGAEDMILRSAGFQKVASKIKAIEVEFHLPTWQELVKYMMGLGYQARRYESSAIIILFTR